MKLSTQISTEITLSLTGTFQPGYPARGPSYSSGGEPAEPDSIEDPWIDAITISRRVWEIQDGVSVSRFEEVDILKGIDTKSAAYGKLVDNILSALNGDAEEALLSEAAE